MWRTIDTAPRDGQHILAMKAGTSFGYMHGQPLPQVQTVVHWFDDPEEPGFYISISEADPQHPFDATHWKPLERFVDRRG